MKRLKNININTGSAQSDPYKLLAISILRQALQDYSYRRHRKEVMVWITMRQGTFDLIAEACDLEPELLQEWCLKWIADLWRE